jgi:polyisoprenoid-binding protein YceI
MKKCLPLLVGAALCCTSLPARAGDTYKIDPVHSSISFKVRHFFSYVNGNFTKFEGTIRVDRRRQHRHEKREARRGPAQRRFLRCREIPEDYFQK